VRAGAQLNLVFGVHETCAGLDIIKDHMTEKELLALKPGALLRSLPGAYPNGGKFCLVFIRHVWPEVAEDVEDLLPECEKTWWGARYEPGYEGFVTLSFPAHTILLYRRVA